MKYIYLILSSILVLSGCNSSSEKQVESAPIVKGDMIHLNPEQMRLAGITIGKVMDTMLSGTLHVHGRIDVPPQNLASITVPMGGVIRSIKVMPGMKIRKGESIAVLEDQAYIQLQEDYLTTKARLIQAESDYQRQKGLMEAKAGSDKTLEKAKAEYQMLKVMQNSLAQKLRLIYINPQNVNENTISRSISIPAPFTGYVTKVMVNVGRYVNQSDILFEMVNPNDIHLALKVFEKDVLNLSIGQTLQSYLNSKPEKRHQCDIILISNSIHEDGTAEVHCHFKKYDSTLVPGMFMNADIELARHRSIAVREEAVTEFEDKNYIFLKTGENTFTMREVKVGAREHGLVEILDGNSLSKAPIAIGGAYSLLMAIKNIE
jgi:cobalt-zinc-cadmium efflux system membrane fusion protein